jgi:DivIVA domain-containing protein
MGHALTPEEIKGADFSVALRGYDRREVGAFLEDVAAEVSVLKESSERAYQAVGEELGQLLQQAKDVADRVLSDAQSSAAALGQGAANEAAGLREDAQAYAKQVRVEADGEAASTRDEADQDAVQRISTADNKVRELSTREAEIRERIRLLRVELEEVAKSLLQLVPDGSPPDDMEQTSEEQTDQQDPVDTVQNGVVQVPAR